MAGLLFGLCALYNLLGPPKIMFQNGTYQLYGVNRRICPQIDPYRDTIFELYTRYNPTEPQYLRLNEENTVTSSYIDFNLPTIIFFHGFLESSRSDNAVQIKRHYLNRGDYNVILVSDERLLAGPDYITAALNVEPIARYAAKFVDFLVHLGLQLSNLHIIGMSLGAQIAGLIGKNVETGKISRITGLDPAGPIFAFLPPSKRINRDDAEFVDIIHTNAGLNGIKYESGDVDIWVNGGTFQPGCSILEVKERVPGSISELVFCNHYQSYRMYVMSLINSLEYPVTKCHSYTSYLQGECEANHKTFLGVDIDRSARGNYYIKTGVTAVNI